MYYEIVITKTTKPQGSNGENYQTWDNINKKFATLKEVKEYLKDELPKKCKRVKQMQDRKDGEAVQTGWIYCYKYDQYEDGKTINYFAQDWVTVYHVKAIEILNY